jgi:alkylated DNA repair dioxygenase AlkB
MKADRYAPPLNLGRTVQQRCNHTLYVPGFFAAAEADAMLRRLRHEPIAWVQEQLKMFGRMMPVPRLTAWMGDAGLNYRYSGTDHWGAGFAGVIAELRHRLQDRLRHPFNFVLMNHYRDGSDSMGWHADDEIELGPSPTIASISFGAARRFKMKRVSMTCGEPRTVEEFHLDHGSLLLMYGDSQRLWRHCLPKTRRPTGARINLTFRNVLR